LKLFEINFTSNPNKSIIVIREGYGVTYDFDYGGNQVTDQRPKALSLGKWRSGRGNNLMAGINLNYLSPEQINRLQQNLPRILRNRNLQTRARTLRAIMPDIFNTAYRTYYKDAVDNVEKGTLRFMSVDYERPAPDPENIQAAEPETAPTATTDADDVTAPQLEPKEPEPEEPEEEPEEVEEPTIKQPTPPRQPERPDRPTDNTEVGEEPEDEEEV